MAVTKFYNASLKYGGAYSNADDGTALPHVVSATLEFNADMLEDTEMGRTTHTNVSGLLNWTLTIECNQDWAASNVDAVAFPLVGASSGTVLKLKPDAGAISTSNPQYYMTGLLSGYAPVSGKVGDLPKVQLKFVPTGANAALVRVTA